MKEDAKIIYIILLEFLRFKNTAKPLPKGYKMHDMYYSVLLAELVETFILDTKGNPLKLFDAVSDAEAKKGSWATMRIYRKILEKERRGKFMNLMFVLDKRKKFRQINPKTL